MTISIRRFRAFPSSFALLIRGRNSPKLAALIRSGGIPDAIITWTTASDRPDASSQF